MDALSAVLAPVRLQKTMWASTLARSPWGLAVPAARCCVRFHYLRRGSAWLSMDRSERVALSGGDLAVFPLGHGHVLRDDPRSPVRSWEDVARCGTEPMPGVIHMGLGTKGPETTFITGAFVLDDPLATPILSTLPPLIRMQPEAEAAVPSFAENIEFIAREVETNRPGSEVVLLRMADVMFIQILRAYLARLPEEGTGFLGALRDPSTAAALGVMHRRPEAPWTVASLAEEVGLSRSVFAARFTRLVGEPPLSYLTRLRMQKAGTLLRDGATLAKVARLAGYASEASFSHAFRQWAGMSPGAWRKRWRNR